MGCESLMTLSLLCFLGSLPRRLGKDEVFFFKVGVQQVVRKQTDYGSQTGSRKYRVNGKKFYNAAYFDVFWSQTRLCETYCGTSDM